MPVKVYIPNVRLAFPEIFEPKQFQGTGDPAYTASVILNPNDPENAKSIADIKAAINSVAKAEWEAKAELVLKSLPADKLCLRNGNLKAEWAGFENMLYVSVRNKPSNKPLVIDKDRTKLTAESGRPYGGCYVNASIEIWPQDNGFGKRINASLRGVQFLKDGDAFAGGAPADESEFENISDFGGEPDITADLL